MKKLAAAIALFAAVVAGIVINLSRASQEPLVTTPDPLQVARQQLHEQLVQSVQREAEIEKQDWNSIVLLRELINAHQERMAKLTGNPEAAEIIAHDRDAISRLEKRIEELVAVAPEKPPAAEKQPSPHR